MSSSVVYHSFVIDFITEHVCTTDADHCGFVKFHFGLIVFLFKILLFLFW